MLSTARSCMAPASSIFSDLSLVAIFIDKKPKPNLTKSTPGFLFSPQVQNETVQLHLMAALQSLSREGELLPANQREVLSAMLREHGVTATPHASDTALPHHRRSFTASPDSSGSVAHLGASSQTPPGVPRHSTNMTRRPSDLGPSISGVHRGLSVLKLALR